LNYPTIVNNIPKESNVYNNTLDDFAKLDNNLAKSQIDIGESSNLAQLSQSYANTFDDEKYSNHVCTLSVLAQVAIDNSKRRFDIDLTEEIKRIKEDLNVKENKYPRFWKQIKFDFNENNINNDITCPMNYLGDIKFSNISSAKDRLPMSEFFIKHDNPEDKNRRKSMKVEDLIEKYSLELYNHRFIDLDYGNGLYSQNNDLLLRNDFDNLISDIRKTYISKNYLGLMSWLINRAFTIGAGAKSKSLTMKSALKKNKPLLLKVLYELNKDAFLKCFSEKLGATI